MYNRTIINRKQGINSNKLLLFCLLVSLFKPMGIESIPLMRPLNILLTFGQVIALAVALYLYRYQIISLVFISAFLLGYLPTMVSLLNINYACVTSSQFSTWFKILAIIMICEAQISRGDLIDLLDAIFGATILILVSNLCITYIWNPNEIYSTGKQAGDVISNVFFGQKNTLRNPIILGFLSVCLRQEWHAHVTLHHFVFNALALANLALIDSATSSVVYIMILVLFYGSKVAGVKLNPFLLLLVSGIVWIIVVAIGNLDILRDFIQQALNRDMSLSGRTTIWSSATEMFIQSPLLGNGIDASIAWFNRYNSDLIVSHAHNAILDQAVRGGVVCASLFVFILVNAVKHLNSAVNISIRNGCCVALFGFLIAGVFGELWNPAFYAVVALCVNADVVSAQRVLPETPSKTECEIK